jgi:hypothetical protein
MSLKRRTPLGTAMFVVSFVLLMAAFIWRKSLYHPKRSAGQEEIDFDVLTLVHNTSFCTARCFTLHS